MMDFNMFLTHIIFILPVLAIATAAENITSNITKKYDVKKVDISKKTYGGKELTPSPKILTVTEEIWFDLKISNYYGRGNHFKQRITIGCFGKSTPATCLNFVSFAKGFKKGELFMSYRGTKVQSIIRDFLIQLGDVKSRFPSSVSIYGTRFHDENFDLSHTSAGWVGMANFGPDSNGSQFYVVLRRARWLDGKHVIFGKVIKGMDALETLAQEETREDNTPLRAVVLENCGVVGLKVPYNLTADQLNTDGDIKK
uniref:Peptidyl-prolyl cis-trans isomerase n=1 Tax=Arion vulgaris TaxID=1028688 RepID=A0A0B7A9Z7_9EUPU